MKLKILALIFGVLFFQAIAMAETQNNLQDSNIWKETKDWEETYGDYRLWRYDVLADFGAHYDSVPGMNFNNAAVPILPSIDDISEEEAIAFAIRYLPLYNGKVQEEQLLHCVVSTRFSKSDSEYSYISCNGSWIISFWNTNNSNVELLCYVYLDGSSGSAQFAFFPDDSGYVGPPESAIKIEG